MCDQQRWLERRRIILLLVCVYCLRRPPSPTGRPPSRPLMVSGRPSSRFPSYCQYLRYVRLPKPSLQRSPASPGHPRHPLLAARATHFISWILAPIPRVALRPPTLPALPHAHPHSAEVSKGAPAQLAAMDITVESLVRVGRYVVTATDPPAQCLCAAPRTTVFRPRRSPALNR